MLEEDRGDGDFATRFLVVPSHCIDVDTSLHTIMTAGIDAFLWPWLSAAATADLSVASSARAHLYVGHDGRQCALADDNCKLRTGTGVSGVAAPVRLAKLGTPARPVLRLASRSRPPPNEEQSPP